MQNAKIKMKIQNAKRIINFSFEPLDFSILSIWLRSDDEVQQSQLDSESRFLFLQDPASSGDDIVCHF